MPPVKKPKILRRLVKQLEDKGMPTGTAHAIATKQLQKSGNLKKGSTKATPKGVKRGNMTPAARAKDRASKTSKSNVKPKDLVYVRKSNSVRKKPGKKK